MKNYVGEIFGDYLIIKKLPNYYGNTSAYKGICSKCGNIKITSIAHFQKSKYIHSYKYCQENFINKDLMNNTFGDMYVFGYNMRKKNKESCFLCVRCNVCGTEREVAFGDFYTKKAGHNHAQSCTLQLEYDKKFYYTWRNIVQRCTDKNDASYEHYGARGITTEYLGNFVKFHNDMWESYSKHIKKYGEKNTTIDRIDVNGNYVKSNIRWTTNDVQSANKRNNRKFIALSPNGEATFHMAQRQCAKEIGISQASIRKCLNEEIKHCKGWYFKYC